MLVPNWANWEEWASCKLECDQKGTLRLRKCYLNVRNKSIIETITKHNMSDKNILSYFNKPKKIADLMVKLDSILLVTFFLSLMYKKIPNIIEPMISS